MTTSPPIPGDELLRLVNGLTRLERSLLLGTAPHWGSWMFMVGSDLVAKGLGRKDRGSIYLDTKLADQVRATLNRTPSNEA